MNGERNTKSEQKAESEMQKAEWRWYGMGSGCCMGR